MDLHTLILTGLDVKIINFKPNKETKLCGKYESSNILIENSKCKCGREKWYHSEVKKNSTNTKLSSN